jgi:predicted component of type VI protein secretion system
MTNNPLFASESDLHVQSPAGRWSNGTFVTTDTAYSPCIDAGDPATAYGSEPVPHGSRVNLGAYGTTAQASKSPNAAPQVADRGMGFLDYTRATISGELVSASAVIAEVGVCYGTNSVAGDTTNGWQYVGRVYPPQQTGTVFSVTTPYLLTNTTYYYR